MTTKNSPEGQVRAQAVNIAKTLKAVSRGEKVTNDPAGKIASALSKPSITFGIVMDDKVLKVEMPWSTIRETDEHGIVEWIVGQMRETSAPLQ